MNPIKKALCQTANQFSSQSLLNCYLREVAAPNKNIIVKKPLSTQGWPNELTTIQNSVHCPYLFLELPETRQQLMVLVDKASLTQNYQYHSSTYLVTEGLPDKQLDYQEQAYYILRELALLFEQPFNDELFSQIKNSYQLTDLITQAEHPLVLTENAIAAYLQSEQLLSQGHSFHPAPKSREGFTHSQLKAYSPELHTRFSLHYFLVEDGLIVEESMLTESCSDIIARYAPSSIKSETGFTPIPVHPWQAEYLITLPLVKDAIKQGKIRYLGRQEGDFHPTSSVRTLFRPETPFFYKCSLNVRLTNCVRKNSFYELESALFLSKLLKESVSDELKQLFPHLVLMEEPAYMSVKLGGGGDKKSQRDVLEGFGLILRETVKENLLNECTPLLAGALFSQPIRGSALICGLLNQLSEQPGIGYQKAACRWFSQYVELLLHPVLYSFFKLGIVYETHLQNVLIGVNNNLPAQLLIRDMEGVKLIPEYWPADDLSELSDKAKRSIYYGEQQGWNRTAYCLFVNNLCQAIFYISAGERTLEAKLWSLVGHQLQRYQSLYGCAKSNKRINSLLNGAPLPNKTNLLTRVLKHSDKQSGYVPLTNPITSPIERVSL